MIKMVPGMWDGDLMEHLVLSASLRYCKVTLPHSKFEINMSPGSPRHRGYSLDCVNYQWELCGASLSTFRYTGACLGMFQCFRGKRYSSCREALMQPYREIGPGRIQVLKNRVVPCGSITEIFLFPAIVCGRDYWLSQTQN